MSPREKWWEPHDRHAAKLAAIRANDDSPETELAFALAARSWFARPSLLDTVAEAMGGSDA